MNARLGTSGLARSGPRHRRHRPLLGAGHGYGYDARSSRWARTDGLHLSRRRDGHRGGRRVAPGTDARPRRPPRRRAGRGVDMPMAGGGHLRRDAPEPGLLRSVDNDPPCVGRRYGACLTTQPRLTATLGGIDPHVLRRPLARRARDLAARRHSAAARCCSAGYALAILTVCWLDPNCEYMSSVRSAPRPTSRCPFNWAATFAQTRSQSTVRPPFTAGPASRPPMPLPE